MMLEKVKKDYLEAVFDTDGEKAMRVIRDAVAGGVQPEDIVFNVVVPTLDLMVKAFAENMDANLAQHYMTAQIASYVTEEMIPKFKKNPASGGTIVIGTAYGDFHSLGKMIVSGCLKARMIKIVDLGVNVAAERFVSEALAAGAHVIAISAMMVHTAHGEKGCQGVRKLLKEKNLENKIKIIVGGAPFRFDSELYKTVGADAYADDGVTAGKIIENLIREVLE